MMLGDILSLARRSGGSVEAWLAADPALAARLREAARQADTDPGGYLGLAVADFTAYASEEDWATLTSRLRNAEDPGHACAMTMIRWRLDNTAADAPQTHSEATP